MRRTSRARTSPPPLASVPAALRYPLLTLGYIALIILGIASLPVLAAVGLLYILFFPLIAIGWGVITGGRL